jgi:hypothetical protein
MIVVGIYILKGTEYKRLDLFSDENISITSAIQDANDISKTKTDFSQSFTIPANTINNSIFQHWYENKIDGGYDAKVRKDAYITLDTKVFRTGKIQLEKVSLKDDLPQSYTITFFGSLVSLKDTFNGLMLSNLTDNTFDFSYSISSVVTKVTTQTNDAVKFPLITSNRVWNYGGTDTANDININTIAVNELFPALRVKNILDLIQSKFGISFTGTFITSNELFLRAYLWLKNADLFKVKGQYLKINYQTQTFGTTIGMSFNLTTDILNLTFDSSVLNRKVTLNITNTVAGINYSVYCFKDGLEFTKVDNISIVGTQSMEVFQKSGNAVDNSNYEFYLSSGAPLTFTSTATLFCSYEDGIPKPDTSYINQTTAQTTTSTIAIAPYFPIMKIEDFFTGILKTFNLVCYSEEKGVYKLEQLETYYAQGNTLDITEFIITDTKSIDRIKPYNKVKFEHEKSQSLNNIKFAGDNGREYGDLSQGFEADGGEYNIKLPFETLLFSKLSGTLQAGYSIKTDLKAYIPKPVIIYDYGVLQTVPSFKLNGSSYSTYNAFGSETAIGLDDYSLNFGAEVSSLSGSIVFNSLYSQFYNAYLNNLYSEKSRIFKTSAILPISYLTSSSATCLKLNTKIIISGKKYVINSFSTNLITGVVELDLINDFRDITLPNALANYITTDNLEIITTEDLIPLTITT